MIDLTNEQKESMANLVDGFRTFLKTEEAQEWQKEREEKSTLFVNLLAKDNIDGLTEKGFGTIIIKLWASQIWGNKEYLVKKILKEMVFQKLRLNSKN